MYMQVFLLNVHRSYKVLQMERGQWQNRSMQNIWIWIKTFNILISRRGHSTLFLIGKKVGVNTLKPFWSWYKGNNYLIIRKSSMKAARLCEASWTTWSKVGTGKTAWSPWKILIQAFEILSDKVLARSRYTPTPFEAKKSYLYCLHAMPWLWTWKVFCD